jgi:predicted small lipoprotein YifL
LLNRRAALRALIGALITVLGTSACGQKGPLYAPGEEPEVDQKLGRKGRKKT